MALIDKRGRGASLLPMKRLLFLLAGLALLAGCRTDDDNKGGGRGGGGTTVGKGEHEEFEPGNYHYVEGRDINTKDGSMVWSRIGKTIVVKQTIVIRDGETFDGKMPNGRLAQYVADPATMGKGDQEEGQKPIFELRHGTLQNVIIGGKGKSAADGVHCRLDRSRRQGPKARLYQVEWRNVGEDAVTARGKGQVLLDRCKIAFASDKTIQIATSFSGEVVAVECQWYRCQKVFRSGNNPPGRQFMELLGGSGSHIHYVMFARGSRVRGRIRGFKGYNIKKWVVEENGADVDEED